MAIVGNNLVLNPFVCKHAYTHASKYSRDNNWTQYLVEHNVLVPNPSQKYTHMSFDVFGRLGEFYSKFCDVFASFFAYALHEVILAAQQYTADEVAEIIMNLPKQLQRFGTGRR